MELWYVVTRYVFETMQDAMEYCKAEHISETCIRVEKAIN